MMVARIDDRAARRVPGVAVHVDRDDGVVAVDAARSHSRFVETEIRQKACYQRPNNGNKKRGKWRNPTKCGWISNLSCKKPNPHLVRVPVNLGECPAAHANFHRGLGEFPVCLGEFPAVRAHFQQARAAFHRSCHCFRPFGVFYISPEQFQPHRTLPWTSR